MICGPSFPPVSPHFANLSRARTKRRDRALSVKFSQRLGPLLAVAELCSSGIHRFWPCGRALDPTSTSCTSTPPNQLRRRCPSSPYAFHSLIVRRGAPGQTCRPRTQGRRDFKTTYSDSQTISRNSSSPPPAHLIILLPWTPPSVLRRCATHQQDPQARCPFDAQ